MHTGRIRRGVFSRHALKWWHDDAELAKIRVEIAEAIKNLPKP